MANQSGSRGSDRRPTKNERREQARVEREQILRRQTARSRNRTIAIVSVVVLAVVAIAAVALASGGSGSNSASPSGSASSAPGDLPGMLTTPPPWDPNTAELAQRLALLNLPGVSDVINHHHARLWIYDAGQEVSVPADIGLSQSAASPLHTHVDDGVIHIEADDTAFEGTLGEFFDVWGVRLTSTCLGGLCNQGDETLHVFVDGKAYTGDPRAIPLPDRSAIVLAYGTDAQLPDPLPNAFDFGGEPEV